MAFSGFLGSGQATYFPVVVTLGIQSAQDTKTTAGLTGPLTNGQVSATNKPAGSTYSASGGHSGNEPCLTISSSMSISNWDFTGIELNIEGNVTVSLTNCKLAAGSGQYLILAVGDASGAPNVTFTNCLIDGTATSVGFNLALVLLYSGQGSFVQCVFQGFPGAGIVQANRDSSNGFTPLTLDHCYLTTYALHGAATAHFEMFHVFQGASLVLATTITYCWFDGTNCLTLPQSGGSIGNYSGTLFGEDLANFSMDHSIVAGGSPGTTPSLTSQNNPNAMQIGTGTYTYTSNALQTGFGNSTSHVLIGGGSPTVTATGNRDFDANSPISLPG